jgi:putative transposase
MAKKLSEKGMQRSRNVYIIGMEQLSYPTALTDNEWHLSEPLLPPPSTPGRRRKYVWRDRLNAIFDVLRAGCQWRLLPHHFLTWKTAYPYLRAWRQDGTWKRIRICLHEPIPLRCFPCYSALNLLVVHGKSW